MGTKGEQTREHILSTAERLILQRGYSGTSIEQIITESAITKGGFFYHFDGKRDLARSLIRRYLEQDAVFFHALLRRAGELTEDPLQQLLIFLKLMAEAMQDLPASHPGCLVASFTYESHHFDEEVRSLNARGIYSWREMFRNQLSRVAEQYPMKIEQDLDTLADTLTAIIEGGIVISRCVDDKDVLPAQLLQYRNYIRLLFGDA
jgi:TetR/AcrR family transcriptional repressor of nem operon